jgi:TPR repeat protein
MRFRSFALASALALLATAARAQDDNPYAEDTRDCHLSAYDCAMEAYNRYGPASGAYWFRHAARRGSTQAMRALGAIYVRGEPGVPRNTAEGMSWFYEAALRNDADAMYALSQGFERGVGVERDAQLARYWLRRAADNGHDRAQRALRR